MQYIEMSTGYWTCIVAQCDWTSVNLTKTWNFILHDPPSLMPSFSAIVYITFPGEDNLGRSCYQHNTIKACANKDPALTNSCKTQRLCRKYYTMILIWMMQWCFQMLNGVVLCVKTSYGDQIMRIRTIPTIWGLPTTMSKDLARVIAMLNLLGLLRNPME